jgi:hypothetical protein
MRTNLVTFYLDFKPVVTFFLDFKPAVVLYLLLFNDGLDIIFI